MNNKYNPDLIKETDRDVVVIPDKYNTGPKPGIVFKKLTQTGSVEELTINIRTDTKTPFYNVSSHGPNQDNLPDEVFIEGYDFSDMDFTVQGSDRYSNSKHITFENCKFKGFRNDATSSDKSRIYFTFNHCSFAGGVNSAYITLNDCKIGGFTSDAMNPLREVFVNNLYIYDLIHEANTKGVHVDGIQIYGDQRSRNNVVDGKWIPTVETGDIHFYNVRFEFPSINFGGVNSYANACVMFQLEFSDVDNVSFENLYVNGGGKWFPLYLDHGKNNDKSVSGSWSHKNLVMKDVMVSDNFGTIFYTDFLEDAAVTNVEHHSTLFVSSVWKDDKGNAHIIVSNDTKADLNLTVKSDVGTKDFMIPHCPSNWVLGGELNAKVQSDEGLTDASGRSYTTYRWEDMPFDLEYVIPGNPKFVLCYQGETQIRYVSFDKKDHYYSELSDSE